MLAQTPGELRFAIPLWGDCLLALVGGAYLVLGSRWPRFFDVLSLTVLGCLAGLVAGVWVPVPQPLVVVVGGVLLGALGAVFRRVSHAVLAAVAMAVILATGAAMVVGHNGSALYLVVGQPGAGQSIMLSGPNLACDAVLAAALVGLLAGAAVAVARMEVSERLVTAAQGAALILLAVAGGPADGRSEARMTLASAFPMTLAVVWAGLVAVGVAAQTGLARRRAAERTP